MGTPPELLHSQNSTLWTQITADKNGLKTVRGKSSAQTNPVPFHSFDLSNNASNNGSAVIVDVTSSRFSKAFKFNGDNASVAHENRQFLQENSTSEEYTPEMLFSSDDWLSRNIFISFWIKIDTENPMPNISAEGHCVAHWAYNGGNADLALLSEPIDVLPLMSIYVNTSRQVSLRFTEMNTFPSPPASVDPGTIYGSGIAPNTAGPLMLQFSSSKRLELKKWYFVTFNLNLSAGWNENEILSDTRLWIDGINDTAATSSSTNPGSVFDQTGWNQHTYQWQVGDLINGWGHYDSGANTLARSAGFAGSFGELTVITQDCSTGYAVEQLAAQENFAKFLYEANTEGVFRLASGVHNSSPRLEQRDLDADNRYPSSWGLDLINYPDVLGSDSEYHDTAQRLEGTLLKDQIQLIEGYRNDTSVVEGFSQSASKEFIRFLKDTHGIVMPHFGLNPNDRLLSDGNWYSDARTEIFPEDKSGFRLSPTTTVGDSSNVFKPAVDVTHIPKVTDDLYKRNSIKSPHAAFKDQSIPPEYNDCHVIEIPIPNGEEFTLSTDLDSDNEVSFIPGNLAFQEWSQFQFNLDFTIYRTGFFDTFEYTDANGVTHTRSIDQGLTEFYQWYLPWASSVAAAFHDGDTGLAEGNSIGGGSATVTWSYVDATNGDTQADGYYDSYEDANQSVTQTPFLLDKLIDFRTAISEYNLGTLPPLTSHKAGRSSFHRDAIFFPLDTKSYQYFGVRVRATPSSGCPNIVNDTQQTASTDLGFLNAEYDPSIHLPNGFSYRYDIRYPDYDGVNYGDPSYCGAGGFNVMGYDGDHYVLRNPNFTDDGVWVDILFVPYWSTFPFAAAIDSSPQDGWPDNFNGGEFVCGHVSDRDPASNTEGQGGKYAIIIQRKQSDNVFDLWMKLRMAINGNTDPMWDDYDGDNCIQYWVPDNTPLHVVPSSSLTTPPNWPNSTSNSVNGNMTWIAGQQGHGGPAILWDDTADDQKGGTTGNWSMVSGSNSTNKGVYAGEMTRATGLPGVVALDGTCRQRLAADEWDPMATTGPNGAGEEPWDYPLSMTFGSSYTNSVSNRPSYNLTLTTFRMEDTEIEVENLSMSDIHVGQGQSIDSFNQQFNLTGHGLYLAETVQVWDPTGGPGGNGAYIPVPLPYPMFRGKANILSYPGNVNPGQFDPFGNPMIQEPQGDGTYSYVIPDEAAFMAENDVTLSGYFDGIKDAVNGQEIPHVTGTDTAVGFDLTNLWEFYYGAEDNPTYGPHPTNLKWDPNATVALQGKPWNTAYSEDLSVWNPNFNPYDDANGHGGVHIEQYHDDAVNTGFTYKTAPNDLSLGTLVNASHQFRKNELANLDDRIIAAVIEQEVLRDPVATSVLADGDSGVIQSQQMPEFFGTTEDITITFTIRLNNAQMMSNTAGWVHPNRDNSWLPRATPYQIKQALVVLFTDAYAAAETATPGPVDFEGTVWPDPVADGLDEFNGMSTSAIAYPSSYSGEFSPTSQVPAIMIIMTNVPNLQDTNQAIRTMAYYNFRDKQWEAVRRDPAAPENDGTYSTYALQPDDATWIKDCDIGFTPMSGIILPIEQNDLERTIQLYGRPTADFGFPFNEKFKSREGQGIDLSQYIHEPMVLKGWEVKQKIIPRVGYQHDDTIDGSAVIGTPDGNMIDNELYYQNHSVKPGFSPFYYGGNGEACVYYDGNSEIGPFRELYTTDGSSLRYIYNKTVPLFKKDNATSTELVPDEESSGIITKGVTAFLLRERDLVNNDIVKDNFYATTHVSSVVGNLIITGSGGSTPARHDPIFDVWLGLNSGTVANELSDSTKAQPTSSADQYFVLEFPYGDKKNEMLSNTASRDAYFGSDSSRDLIGYLQCVYHNEPNPSVLRKNWYRIPSNVSWTESEEWSEPAYNGVKNVIGLLDREADVYVENLLRVNQEQYNFHVSGSMKLTTPMAGSFPISVFHIKANVLNELGVYDSDPALQTSERQPFYAQSIFPTDVGRPFSSSLMAERAVPSVSGVKNPTTTIVPNALYPIKGNTVLPNHTSEITISETETIKCNVILAPTDKLILGIQDSVSSTFASQQCMSGTAAEFIRWGRNQLKIPEQQYGTYLRLYVQHQRQSIGIEVNSNQTDEFSASINRDIGDLKVEDQYIVEPLIAYSGSMADDIVAPSSLLTSSPAAQYRYSAFSLIDQDTDKALLDGGAFWQEWNRYDDKINEVGFLGWENEISLQGNTPTAWDGIIPWNASNIRTVLPYPGLNNSNQLDGKLGASNGASFDGSYPFHAKIGGSTDRANDNSFGLEGTHQWFVQKNASSFPLELPSNVEKRLHYLGVYLRELNPRSDADGDLAVGEFVVQTKSNSHDKTFYPLESPAISAWHLKVPLLYQTTDFDIESINVEFRLVKVLTEDASSGANAVVDAGQVTMIGNSPVWSLDASLGIGDAFFFNSARIPVKINMSLSENDHSLLKGTQAFVNDDTSNPFGSENLDVVYIVAAGGPLGADNYIEDDGSWLTWTQVSRVIADVLAVQKIVNPGLLYEVLSLMPSGAGLFELNYASADEELKSAIAAKLAIDISNSKMEIANLSIELGSNGTMPAGIEEKLVGWYPNPEEGDVNSLARYSNTPGIEAQEFFDDDPNSFPTPHGAFDFLRDMHRTLEGYKFWSTISNWYVKMNFDKIPRKGLEARSSSGSSGGSDNAYINSLIDRHVLLRSTEGTASRFGSLQKTFQLVSEGEIIYDSYMPNFGWKNVPTEINLGELANGPNLSPPINTGWWLEEIPPTQKRFDRFPTRVVSPFIDGGSGYAIPDLANNDPSIEFDVPLNLWPDTAVDDFEVNDTLAETFSSSLEYEDRTIKSLYFGIGIVNFKDASGNRKFHKFRPTSTTTTTYDPAAGTLSTNKVALIMSDIRGARFGFYNITPHSQKFHFRRDSYGQFRDMLEQGIDTKFGTFGEEETTFGAPVRINPINPINPDIPKLMSDTQRYNKRLDATVIKPYIEHGYENTPQLTRLNSESLRVDVPGSIRTRTVTSPGNIAANIRTRG